MGDQNVSLEIKGLDAVRRELAALIKNVGGEVVGDALRSELEIEKTKIERVTPYQFGALRGSITVDKPKVSGREVSCRIYAGGPSAPYALFVHEKVEGVRHEPPTGAKFIERPLNEAVPELAQRIAKRVARLLEQR